MRFVALFIALTITAQAASIWPNGSRLQTFQNGFLFGNGQTIDSASGGFTFGNGAQFNGPFTLEQESTPSNPAVGFNKLYFKNDNNLYKLQENGDEANVSSVAAGGQQQSTASFGELRVPEQQLVRTSTGVGLLETGNKNLLLNGGFEHQTYNVGWTTSGTATYSGTTTDSEVLSGLKSFKAVASAQTIDLLQDTTLLASSRAGSQMFYRFSAKNTAAGVTACVRANGVKLTGGNNCLTLATDNVTRTYELAFLANGTSNGIEIDAASTTGTLIVDEVEISTESSAFIDVAQIGPWVSYTPTFTGFGTPATVEFQYRINGSNLEIRGRFASGTPTAVEARISLPAGFSSAGTATIPSLQIAGYGNISVAGATTYHSLIEPNVTYFTLGRASSAPQAGFAKANGDALVGSGQAISIVAHVPVQGLSNKITTYSQFAVSDVSVENNFVAKVSDSGVVSAENLDWINGNCTPSGGIYTCTFNTGIFTVAPTCQVGQGEVGAGQIAVSLRNSETSTQVDFQFAGAAGRPVRVECTKSPPDYKAKNVITGSFSGIEKCADPYECTDTFSAKISTTGVVTGENLDWINGNCTNANPTVCTFNTSLFTVAPNCAANTANTTQRWVSFTTAAGSITLGRFIDNGTLDNSPVELICQKQGVDFRPKTAVAGTFIDSVVSPSAGKVAYCSARMSAAGAITNQIGGCFTTCNNSTTMTCNFTASYWLAAPNCSVTTNSGSTNLISALNGYATTSSVSVYKQDLGAVAFNHETSIFCHGLIP
jgi:hypothetical protein